ncbi:hypothetical protein L6R52_03890 [Myxococcota bacterium]|nr:hypothetical protein [Myxococcota bacterium]
MTTHLPRSLRCIGALALGLALSAPTSARALSIEDVPIWRLQLRLTTADVSNAGTDDAAYVRLTSASDGKFWMNYGRNDRERGTTQTYDVLAPGVSTIADITRLELGKSGDDGWCIKKIELLVNEVSTPIYSKTYASGQWLDSSGGHSNTLVLSSATLRAYSGWTLSLTHLMPPAQLSASAVESLIEAAIGDALHDQDRLYWRLEGSEYVAATRASASRQAIDVDLAASIDGWADPEVEVDFELRWSCSGGQLQISSEDVSVNVDGALWLDILTLGIQAIVLEVVENKLTPRLESLTFDVSTTLPTCPDSITVDASGNVNLVW